MDELREAMRKANQELEALENEDGWKGMFINWKEK